MKYFIFFLIFILAGCESIPEIKESEEWQQIISATSNRVPGTALPPDFRLLYIFPVYHEPEDKIIAQMLFERLVDLFRKDGTVIPTSNFDEAHGVLALRIVRFARQILTKDDNGFPDETFLACNVRFIVKDLRYNRILLQNEIEEKYVYHRVPKPDETEPPQDETTAVGNLLNKVATNVIKMTVAGFY